MADLFIRRPFSSVDKYIEITGPGDLGIRVDYDDVDHDLVRAQVDTMIEVLNANWPAGIDRALVKTRRKRR